MEKAEHLHLRFYCVILIICFAFGLVGIFSPVFGILFILLGVPALAIALLAGSAVFLFRNFQRLRNEQVAREAKWLLIAIPALLIVTILLSLPLHYAGRHTANLIRLFLNAEIYAEIVARAEMSDEAAGFQDYRGITYSTDIGPPTRVAFHPSGILDNWSAIVFDPTGEMVEFDQESTDEQSQQTGELFGGDLVGCRSLWGDYFYCSFT